MKQITWLINGRSMTDEEVVAAILNRDVTVTKQVLYKECFPLFQAVYKKYYTDCENTLELINEIYVYIMTPLKSTGICKLAGFGFRCTFTIWLKIVTEHYCNQLFAKKIDTVDISDKEPDRIFMNPESLNPDMNTFNMEDVKKILQKMPNERYRKLIEYRYLEEKTNEESAALLMISMANYYNMHLRAKAQFCTQLRKEGLI